MFDRETMGRVAQQELSLFDAMIAEIAEEKDRRLRKFMRKHEIRNDGNPVRKEKRKSYEKELCYCYDPWHGFDHVRNFRSAEKIRTDAEDWKLESAEMAEYMEWERRNAEINRLREEAKAESMRKYAELNEWLKYA